MVSENLARLPSLIADYWLFEQEIAIVKIEEYKKLILAFDKKQDELQELTRHDAPDYNLFDVLGIRHYEVKVHTPFIAQLLILKATHQQGKLQPKTVDLFE